MAINVRTQESPFLEKYHNKIMENKQHTMHNYLFQENLFNLSIHIATPVLILKYSS